MKTIEQLRRVTVSTEQDDIDMISQPDAWPNFPILPLVNRKTHETAFICLLQNGKKRFFQGNVFIRETWKNQKYMTTMQIIKAGWRVD